MKYQMLLTAVLLSTSGCFGVETLYVDSEFSERERDFIERARDEWVIATDTHGEGADVPLSFGYQLGHDFTKDDYLPGPGGDIDILHRVIMDDPGYQALKEQRGFDFEGTTNTHTPRSNRVMVLVMDRINQAPHPDKTLWAVALHEFGHWHGIYDHLDSGIMSPTAEGGCIDQAAVDTVCEWMDCGPHAGSTCE